MTYQIPDILYHSTAAWDGGPLLSLSARLGHVEGIAEFLRRWPLCTRRQAAIDVDLIYMTDSAFGRGQGDIVLAIDPRGLADVEWHMDEDEADGGWVVIDQIPAEAIIGRMDDPTTAPKIERVIAELEVEG